MKESAKHIFDKVKESLLSRKQEIMNRQLQDYSSTDEEGGLVQDIGDRANQLSMERLKCSLGEAEFGEVRLIDSALKRIESGTYGYCVDCEGKISSERLEFCPFAARCIVCQEARES